MAKGALLTINCSDRWSIPFMKRQSLHSVSFWQQARENLDFAILATLCSKTITLEGPSTQIESTRELKLRSRGVRTVRNCSTGAPEAPKASPVRLPWLSELWTGTQRAATGRDGPERAEAPEQRKPKSHATSKT